MSLYCMELGKHNFGEDRFGTNENYSEYYKSIGGEMAREFVNELIIRTYEYLDERYPAEKYRHCFLSLQEAIEVSANIGIAESEKEKIIETFSFHEHGKIPQTYVAALRKLKEQFTLALVIDIWALFSAHSFSSDHGMVKPSPKPFELVVNEIYIPKEKYLVIGDSIRRDLGGAHAAEIDSVLVGGAESDIAIGSYPTLLDFQQNVQSCS